MVFSIVINFIGIGNSSLTSFSFKFTAILEKVDTILIIEEGNSCFDFVIS